MANRYCSSCGRELGEESRFCPSCGRPLHDTASVSTPEAETSVPIPPTVTQQAAGQKHTLRNLALGCVVVPVLLLLIGGLLLGGGGDNTANSPEGGSGQQGSGGQEPSSSPGSSQDNPVAVGETAEIGDVSWQVNNVSQTDTVGDEFDSMSGNFVVVDFAFTNNSDEAVTLDSGSLRILDDQGRESEASIDASLYIPLEKDVFLEEVNPGVTEEGRVIYDVAPDAAGMVLQANDTGMFSENYTYLGLGY